jgi:argininosuccinate lyase
MAKMWAGLTSGMTDKVADDFNSSISFDSRMYKQDITGSIAHAAMLASCGIISDSEKELLTDGLLSILEDMDSGKLLPDMNAEDIHMFVEQELTARIGDTGKKLHTARSRNDQVALDLRLYLRDEAVELKALLKELISALHEQAAAHKSSIMPGYTHLQRAQPISFGHHMLAYCMMLLRDAGRIDDCINRMDVSPIGCCALAGTTYDTDREYEAKLLGFSQIALNSLDGVSDRDYCVELMSALSILMMHLSRLSEELILWCSWEFKFVTLSDNYTTGSSIMPQKKNPDMAELIRGKTGRVYGDLMGLLTTLKGLPLAYNKDMQEDKECVFDAVDTVKACLQVAAPMIKTMTVHEDNMFSAAQKGFINATDLADYLVKKGLPFRSAYKISGSIVAKCMNDGQVLETLPLDVYQSFSPLFDQDLYDAIDLRTCVEKRISQGGTSLRSVEMQLEWVQEKLNKF